MLGKKRVNYFFSLSSGNSKLVQTGLLEAAQSLEDALLQITEEIISHTFQTL